MARPPLKLDRHTLLLLFAQWILFVGNFAAYVQAPMHPLVHIAIGFVPVHFAFTIWHEAVHGTVSNRRWVNHVVGVLGMFPYMTPYFMQRYVHLDHHKYLNEPGRDPNEVYATGPLWQLPIRYLQLFAYAKKVATNDPRMTWMKVSDYFFLALVVSIFGVLIWQGYILGLLVVWLIPMALAKIVMDWYVNYLPHVGLPADRFAGTRIILSGWLTPLILWHNYHAVHHLWPSIPWHAYLQRFNDKREYLEANGVPIEHRVFAVRARSTGLWPARAEDGDVIREES